MFNGKHFVGTKKNSFHRAAAAQGSPLPLGQGERLLVHGYNIKRSNFFINVDSMIIYAVCEAVLKEVERDNASIVWETSSVLGIRSIAGG